MPHRLRRRLSYHKTPRRSAPRGEKRVDAEGGQQTKQFEVVPGMANNTILGSSSISAALPGPLRGFGMQPFTSKDRPTNGPPLTPSLSRQFVLLLSSVANVAL
eukprot:483460-Rhodomonas_salina.2